MRLVDTISKIIPIALAAITVVEKVYGAVQGKGEDKKEAYIDALMVALNITEQTTGKNVINDAEFRDLLGDLGDSVIAIHNYMKDNKVS